MALDGTLTFKTTGLKDALLFSADTWFGVLFTVISEMVSPDVRSVVIAIFLFLMNNVGGQIPLAIHPLQKAFGLNRALLMIWPGCIATCEYYSQWNVKSITGTSSGSPYIYVVYGEKWLKFCFQAHFFKKF